MKIAIFYEHAFEPGGAPEGIRHLAHGLAQHHQPLLWGKAHPIASPLLDNVSCKAYTSHWDLRAKLPGWIQEHQPDVLIVVGFFLLNNVSVARIAHRLGVPVMMHPLAQVWDQVFQGKVFSKGYDVRKLEAQRLNSDEFRQHLASWINPWLKKLYKKSLGRMMMQHCSGVAALSQVEYQQVVRHYPGLDLSCVILPWGIDTIETNGAADYRHFYRDVLGLDSHDGVLNFIVWSRLDWYYKGLDRLLEGVRLLKERLGSEGLPFRLFLSGPDYREGSVHAAQFIAEHGLGHVVQLLLPGAYEPGSKTPLRDADASVLLSRWDGSPRALRESLHYGTPILVSPETNFAWLVREHGGGKVVEDADDPEAVASALMVLVDAIKQGHHEVDTSNLVQWLNWPSVAARFGEDVQAYLGERVA